MIAEPEKELRFTRSGQAAAFWIGAAVCFAAAIWAAMVLGSVFPYQPLAALWRPLAWFLLPLAAGVALGRTALRLTRKAYVILTPLGVEIFPFFRPAEGMRLVSWGEIAAVETDGKGKLTLHFNREKTSGVHLSLKPLRADRRPLLVKAMEARVNARGNS